MEDLSNRTIVTTRVLQFPQETVFRAWSDPAILARWWGPNGFTNTFMSFEFKPGGDWHLMMHGPDGTDYENRSTFRAIDAPQSLRFEHTVPHWYETTTTFEPLGKETRLTMSMLFPDVETVERIGDFIVPANEENFDCLEAVLAALK